MGFFFFFLRQSLTLSPVWSAVVQSQLTAPSASWVQVILLPPPPEELGLQAPQLIFVFLVETGFHHRGQGGFELLISNDPPTSASQSAGITSVSPNCF